MEKRWKAIRLKLHLSNHTLAAIIIILLAIALRVILSALVVPWTESDEGTMGLEAMHIAFQGQHPVYLYGQEYMGVLEAYIAAFFFRLFGVSVFTLRLGMIIMFALFLISMYLLTCLLYTRKLALLTIALLGLGGASDVLAQQLRAVGGAIETLCFGAIVMLLACWLAFTYRQTASRRQKTWRLLAYGGWGLAAGLGLWTHVLILPFVLASALILALFCYRELLSPAPLVLLSCLVIGLLPFILYNIHSSPPWITVSQDLGIHDSTALAQQFGQHIFRKRIIGPSLWSLPLATGLTPVCAISDLPYYGGPTSATIPCAIVHGSWSLGYLILLAVATLTAASASLKVWQVRRAQASAWTQEQREAAIIEFSRFMLLASGVLTLALFIDSPLSAIKPWSTRYLVGLLIVVPALLWPLWTGAGFEKTFFSSQVPSKFAVTLKRGVLLLVVMAILVGTVSTFTSIPGIENENQHEAALVHDLLRIGATRLYAEYWIGYRVMFQSQEQIICAVPPMLLPQGPDRYAPYIAIVKADPQAGYLFTVGEPAARDFANQIARSHKPYRQYTFDGYIVFLPTATG